jgi:hypothetical protein
MKKTQKGPIEVLTYISSMSVIATAGGVGE